MVRNKPRLELALYARPKHAGTYHYALFIAPKSRIHQKKKNGIAPSATKFHVKNTLQEVDGQIEQPWRFESVHIPDLTQEPRLLVCLVIGKIVSTDDEAVERVLRGVPIYQVDDEDQEKAQLFTCRTWVRAALEELRESGVVAGMADWNIIQQRGVEYVAKKNLEGRWEVGWGGGQGGLGIPTKDLLVGRELIH